MIAALMEASVAATGRTPRMRYGDVVCGVPVPLDPKDRPGRAAYCMPLIDPDFD